MYLVHADGALWPCPECGKRLPAYDHKDERVWRHLDTMAFQTWVHARPPRVECQEHGVRQAGVPWAEPNSRFTKFFERFAIDVTQETDTKGAGKILKLSWDEVWGVQERAVARGLRAKPPVALRVMGVDEKAVGHGHQYATIVYNLEKGTVGWVGEDRRKETLDRFFQSLSAEQRTGIEAVGLDMWGPFIASIGEHVPEADGKLVFDPFHIVGHMNEAVNDVRKREHRPLSEEGKSPLVGTRFWWLYGRENLPERHQEGFAALQATHLKTGRAYAIKEALRDRWAQDSSRTGAAYWRWWHFWATQQPPRARDPCGADDEGPPGGGAELLRAPHHERGGGGTELEDRDDPEDGLRVPEQGPLPDGGPVPVWGTSATPGDPPDSRMSRKGLGRPRGPARAPRDGGR